MVKPNSQNSSSQKFTPEQYARLKAEMSAPYRGLRKFIYLGFGASGFIGAFLFCLQLLAGRNPTKILPNLALQLGVIALVIFLWRWEQRREG